MPRYLLIAIAIAGCGEPVPAAPTWFADVAPIVVANCGRCHGAFPADERVAGVRLDRYVAGDDATLDAWDYRESIVRQAVAGDAPVMPPSYRLTERQQEILELWLANGAPKGTRANAPPTAALAGDPLPASVDQALAFELRAGDPDGDGLLVAIGVVDPALGERRMFHAGLGSGLHALSLDTGQLASGTAYDVFAIVDDGFADDPDLNQHEVVLAAGVLVDHGARGTAPTVTLLNPNGGETLLDDTAITWSAVDPDPGDTLTIDLDLVRVAADGSGSVVASIARGLSGGSSFSWDVSSVPAEEGGVAIPYRVRVTATDAGGLNTRSDESDQSFTIAPPPVVTALTWADVKPIFDRVCRGCHGQPARTVALEYFRLDKYDAADPEAPSNGDLGVYEMRSLVYTRLVSAGTMPPPAAPQPTAAEIATVRDWILGGAPRDGGSGDGLPAFTWITPSDAAISTTTTGTITLAWTASDPEDLPLTGAIAYARITAPSDQMAQCNAAVTGWTDLPVAVDAGSHVWTLPQQGYYCLRGTVTDAAMQTTVRVAARPVKWRTTGP